ncbi:hypothetical protein BJV78DRAFT_1223700 [Lactifluus subvellereus]|nr:hypothetical protein BJV78DRAFT_1223700 [Lactifluus subvellereus]
MRSRAAMSLRVLIKEPLGNASASTWPSVLSLDFTQYKLSTLELQQWMKDSEAVMVWFAPAAESDVHEFAQLVKWLRERECYAVASWDIQGRGRPTPHLLLVPLGEELIGAAFPTSDMPQLPLPEPRDPLVRRVVIIF